MSLVRTCNIVNSLSKLRLLFWILLASRLILITWECFDFPVSSLINIFGRRWNYPLKHSIYRNILEFWTITIQLAAISTAFEMLKYSQGHVTTDLQFCIKIKCWEIFITFWYRRAAEDRFFVAFLKSDVVSTPNSQRMERTFRVEVPPSQWKK